MTSLNNDNEGLLLMGGGTTKRLYTVGNYSKFIRPGYRRVTLSGTPPDGRGADRVREPDRRNGGHRGHQQRHRPRSRSRSIFPASALRDDALGDLGQRQSRVARRAVNVSGSRLAPMLAAMSVTTFVGKP